MSNKRNTYLLIAALLGVWGFIGYQFFANMKDDIELSTSTAVKPNNEVKNKVDSFDIVANYSDPFKVNQVQKVKQVYPSTNIAPKRQETSKQNTQKKEVQSKIDVNHIQYFGVISNSKTGKKVGILHINNKEILVSNGTEFESGKVISVFDEKVKIVYKESTFEIERKD